MGLARMGSAYGNDEEAFGGYGMGGYNGVTSGSDAQGTELTIISLSLNVKICYNIALVIIFITLHF